MRTQQGYPSASPDAPNQLIDDVDGFSHEAFLDLSAAQFIGVQEQQMTTILTENCSTFDPLQNPLMNDPQLDLPFDDSFLVIGNGFPHQHNVGQSHTSNYDNAAIGNAATPVENLFIPRNDPPILTFQCPVEERPSNNALSGDSDESQRSDSQALSTPSSSDFPYEDFLNLTPFETPSDTPGGSISVHGSDSIHLSVTPEGTSPWYFLSPQASLGAASSSNGGSEGNSPSSFVHVPRPESLHGASATNSPANHEQRIVSKPRPARTVPRLIFPTSKDQNAHGMGAAEFTDFSIRPAPPVGGATLHRSSKPITQDWGGKVSASKRKQEEKVEESREQAKRVRKVGACVRCHMYKFKCDEGFPCQKCLHDETTHRLFFQPCSRQEILDAILVRHGNGKFGQERVKFRKYRWTNPKSAPRTVEICWALPGNVSRLIQGLIVPCHEFNPRPDDITAENWQVDGKVSTVDLPRFACADERKLKELIEEMVEQNRAAVETQMEQSITDPLVGATFAEAHRYAREHNSKIIDLAFRIRSTAAVCQGWGSIVGADSLGTPEVDNAEDGYCGTRPISPALCHQIDVVFLQMMARDEQALVKELKKAIFRKNPKPWYEIFLTYFVIMWHLKYIHGQAVGFKRSQEQTNTGEKVSFVVNSMVQEWENSAGNMLYHFRYVLRAFLPFQTARENMAAVREKVNLDDHAVSYLRTAVSLLDERGWLEERSNDATKEANEDPDDKWVRRLFEP